MGLAGLPAGEYTVKSAGGMNQAGTFFPTAPPLLEFSGSGIFRMAALAFLAMASIKLEGHALIVKQHCTLLHAKNGDFV
jgi:hypothetical protein